MTILLATGMVFVIIWDMFHERISLSSVLLLLLGNFVSGLRLKLMYISLIKNIRSSLTYLHDLQLLVLLPYFTEITFFVWTKRINLLILKKRSGRLVIVTKGFLKLTNLHMALQLAFGLLVFFTNLSLMEFHIRYLALFLLFSVTDGFTWFCIESRH